MQQIATVRTRESDKVQPEKKKEKKQRNIFGQPFADSREGRRKEVESERGREREREIGRASCRERVSSPV